MTDFPKLEDLDPVETQEWLESIDSVLRTVPLRGLARACSSLQRSGSGRSANARGWAVSATMTKIASHWPARALEPARTRVTLGN